MPWAAKPVGHHCGAHVSQLLKSVRLETVLCSKRSHRHEKPVDRDKEQPPLPETRESPSAATKTQGSQTNKSVLKKKKEPTKEIKTEPVQALPLGSWQQRAACNSNAPIQQSTRGAVGPPGPQ